MATILSCGMCREAGDRYTEPYSDEGIERMDTHLRDVHDNYEPEGE